jgi:hypothetical protein
MKNFNLMYKVTKVVLIISVLGFMLTSCKKDSNIASPVISRVRAITPAPNDSVLTKVLPGQLVVLQGSNFTNVKAVYFDGVMATFNVALAADNNLVITVPSGIDFTKIAASEVNTIRMITASGEVTFKFPISPPPPIVTAVSNEYALPGSTLTLYGQYLYLINKVSFTGGDATNIVSATDGLSLTLTIPAGATTGNIIVNGQGGTATYISYNDKTTGMLCNFDNINNYSYGASIKNDALLFPGNTGYYAEMFTTAPIATFDYAWYNSNRSINLNAVQWVPKANLADPVSSYALKFEVYVTKPWQGGTVMIRRADESSWVYICRYEPWRRSPANVNFTTTGWTTVIMPLTNFKMKTSLGEGTGASAVSLSQLINSVDVNATGSRQLGFMLINDQNVAGLTVVDVAIDNIRIVKIK